MGRPKGSKKKAREEVTAAPYAGYQQIAPVTNAYANTINQMAGEPYQDTVAKPALLTITLTDEDLAPARRAKANHAKAAAKYQQDEIASELRRKEIGEVEELSVPQVVPFDLSAAFSKIAAQKARLAGYRFAHNLRKTPDGWVFQASNSPKVQHDPAADQ